MSDRYDELMARRARLMEAWMERVDESKRRRGERSDIEFWSPGVVLDSKGVLRLTAFAPDSWGRLWELEIRPGESVVRCTYAEDMI